MIASYFSMITSFANVFRAAVVSLLFVPAHAFDHSHSALDHVLKAHVRDAAVDYVALKAAPGPLDACLDQLAAVSEAEFNGWTEAERLAFLINLYNAATLKLIAENYPVKSIKSIGWVPGSAWKQAGVRLFGKKISLDEVEHGIIRKQSKEARVHFALVCAARGCPPLRAEAFVAARLDAQLQDQGMIFIRDRGKNRADVATRTLYLSKIFKWFAGDFEAASGSVQKFVAPFFPEESRAALAVGDFKIAYTDYDWSLNDQAKE